MKIRLEQGTWLEMEERMYDPGDIVEINHAAAMSMILGGSATEVKEEVSSNVNKTGSSSGKT